MFVLPSIRGGLLRAILKHLQLLRRGIKPTRTLKDPKNIFTMLSKRVGEGSIVRPSGITKCFFPIALCLGL